MVLPKNLQLDTGWRYVSRKGGADHTGKELTTHWGRSFISRKPMQGKVGILMQLVISWMRRLKGSQRLWRYRKISTIVTISGRVVVTPTAGQEVKVQRNKCLCERSKLSPAYNFLRKYWSHILFEAGNMYQDLFSKQVWILLEKRLTAERFACLKIVCCQVCLETGRWTGGPKKTGRL